MTDTVQIPFHKKRRQHFLSEERLELFEQYYADSMPTYEKWIATGDTIEKNNGYWAIAENLWDMLCISYTKGAEIKSLSFLLEQIIVAEDNAIEFWKQYKNILQDNGYYTSPMLWFYVENYLKVIQLISLCYLLQREDLLERLLKVILENAVDDLEPDSTIEDFFYYHFKDRPDPGYIQMGKHAVLISEAICGATKEEQLEYLNAYLKDWYKEMVGMSDSEYNSHLDPEQNGFCGYWSFEAAAIVYLDDLDDTSLRQYPYYPKDIVDWAREQKQQRLQAEDQSGHRPLLLKAGMPAPFAGKYGPDNFIGHEILLKQGEKLPTGQVSAVRDGEGNPVYRNDTVWRLLQRQDSGKVRFKEEELKQWQSE